MCEYSALCRRLPLVAVSLVGLQAVSMYDYDCGSGSGIVCRLDHGGIFTSL